jgi:hypothetical protein
VQPAARSSMKPWVLCTSWHSSWQSFEYVHLQSDLVLLYILWNCFNSDFYSGIYNFEVLKVVSTI